MSFAGLTPFPYKVITITSGVTGLDPVAFGIASVLAPAQVLCGRGAAVVVRTAVEAVIERNRGWLTVALLVLLFGLPAGEAAGIRGEATLAMWW